MEVNNFKLIAEHLHFISNDEFYFLQILQRGKDGNKVHGSNKNRLVKYYIIKSVEQFMSYETEIINVCKLFNARAYIHPTKRSFKEVAKVNMRNVFENFASENYINSGREFSTSCGQSWISKDKKYIIDIDEKDSSLMRSIVELIDSYTPEEPIKLCYVVPTVAGYHLICKPFNTHRFSQDMIMQGRKIDVHKNNPTLLYYNKI